MNPNKYLLCVCGGERKNLKRELSGLLGQCPLESLGNCDIHNNRVYNTGLPVNTTNAEGVSLILHGIAFPYGVSLDSFSVDPYPYIKAVILKYRNKLGDIPRGFRNGSFVGIAVDERDASVYAFSSFLNSIPLYYSEYDGCLFICTDYSLIARLTDSTLDQMTQGLIEYYVQGTNLSENTALDKIKSIPKGSYLRFVDGKLDVQYYYTMPDEDTGLSFASALEEFADLWKLNIKTFNSNLFHFGIGITGGVDSRMILSDLADKKRPLLYTGSHPDHPDYLLARYITESLNLTNHILEDYRASDKLLGYAEYTSIADNPLLNNSLHFMDQVRFRIENDLVFELSGGINLIGGIHYYLDRRDYKDTLRRSFGLPKKPMGTQPDSHKLSLINMVLRNDSLYDDLSSIPKHEKDLYINLMIDFFNSSLRQLGNIHYLETYLERMRHIHKSMNLLAWNVVSSRRFLEHILPDMNIDLTDLACRIPLKHRDSRKLLLAYLKKYHPETARFVLSGHVFSARMPWILYKGMYPAINALNHLGYKIPILQWYIKRNAYHSVHSMPEIQVFQKKVCSDSSLLRSSPPLKAVFEDPNNKTRLIRLFNIAVLEKRLLIGEDGLRDYLLGKVEEVRRA